MLKVGVDIDGVLADHVSHLLKYLNRNGCRDLNIMKREDVSKWNINICGKDFKILFEEYLKNKDFILEMPTIDKATESIRTLSLYYKIFIITNRPAYSGDATYKWLKKNGIVFRSLLIGRDIDRLNINIDILIDDNPYAALEFAYKKGISLLYSQPWNENSFKELDREKNIVRCRSWREITEFLLKRYKEIY